MQTIIIVSGHGKYATGMKSSFEFLAGPHENFNFIDFTEDDSDVTLKEKFNNIINNNINASVLFFCDMLGGTPFKAAALIANDKDNMEVVAGCNLVSLIEVGFLNDSLTIKKLAQIAINSSINSVGIFEKVKVAEVKFVETEEGI